MASRLAKLFKALTFLSRPEGATISELADHLGIDRRSAYRQKDEIEELGIPIYDERAPGERKKRWRIIEPYVKRLPNLTVPSIDLTFEEIISLYLLRGQTKLFKETEIQQRLDSAFTKISQLFPEKLTHHLEQLGSIFIPVSKCQKDYKGKEVIIDRCTDAVFRRKTCFVKYHSFSDDQMKSFRIDPLCFFENNGGLYVFVRATSFGDIRILAVERIHEIRLTDDTFEPPADFDPVELLESGFDIVYDDPLDLKIWFSADQAKYIRERKWAKNQKITDRSDGSVILEMQTSAWWHVKKWVLSFGVEAKVLAPKELRNDVLAELARTLEMYGHGPDPIQ